MSLALSTRPARALLGATAIAAGLMAMAGPAIPAHAAVGSCRADPIVWLSDGTKVDVAADFTNARARDVRQIVYTLHVPQGLQTTQIVYTAGELGHKEHLTVIADAAPDLYTAETLSDTAASDVTVLSTLTVFAATKGQNAVTGPDHTPLTTQVVTTGTVALPSGGE